MFEKNVVVCEEISLWYLVLINLQGEGKCKYKKNQIIESSFR